MTTDDQIVRDYRKLLIVLLDAMGTRHYLPVSMWSVGPRAVVFVSNPLPVSIDALAEATIWDGEKMLATAPMQYRRVQNGDYIQLTVALEAL